MKFITIGGVPAVLGWNFFNDNLEENLYKYTQHSSMSENENIREFYLKCALYENIIPLDLFVKWHKSTMNFIKENLHNIIYELKSIKTENTFDKNIELYYKSYEEILKDNVSNTLNTTDKDIIERINDLI